jgi:hypothetical protein
MPDDELLTHDIYSPIYDRASAFITEFATKIGMTDNASDLFNRWLFDDPTTIPWLATRLQINSINDMWRGAHPWRGWQQFSDLALRLITATTSESDAERLLSLEKDVIGHHGTRFTCDGLRNRIWGILSKRLARAEARNEPPDRTTSSIEE